MFLVACKGTETPQEQPSLKVNPLALEFAASGNASQTLTVEAVAVEWTHEVSGAAKEWLTVSKTDAETLTVTVSDNETAEKRSGTVTVSATDHPEMKPIGVTVSQEAGEVTEYSISVNPVSLEFEADSTEPQEVTVTAVGEGLTWTAAAEQGASWLHVEASGDKISVTVDAYEDTELQRAANIIVTPDREGVAAKSVRVTQQPAEEVPSLTVSPTDAMEFAYNETASRMLRVTAVACTWVAEAKDAEGNPAEWIELSVSRLPEELSGNVVVRVQPNSSLEARSGEVVIRTNTEGIEPITIAVTQGPGKEFLSSLTDHVTLEDMNPAGIISRRLRNGIPPLRHPVGNASCGVPGSRVRWTAARTSIPERATYSNSLFIPPASITTTTNSFIFRTACMMCSGTTTFPARSSGCLSPSYREERRIT